MPSNFISTSGNPFTPFSSAWEEQLPRNWYPSSYSLVSETDLLLSHLRSNGIFIKDTIEVEKFLAEHAGIMPYLYELPDVVVSRFGNTNMSLVVFSDPDTIGENELFLEIETKLTPKEANPKLNELNNSWLLNIEDDNAHLFNTCLNFKK